jgi:hypothetical protein
LRTHFIWAALIGAALPACATAIQDDPLPPVVKKDAAAFDTGKPDSGSMMQADTGVMEDTGIVEDTGSGCTLGINYGTAMCQTCMQTNCCAQDKACVQNSQCTNFLTCGNACVNQMDPQTCMNNCANQYPQGASLLDNIFTCMETSCGNDCR